jgi:Uma2 family endonuclease
MSLTRERVEPQAVHYPEGDGKPMAETDLHRDLMIYFIEALKSWFRGQEVYVSGNILLYYEEGNPRRSVSPDVLVAFGLRPERRRTYKTWEEGKAPDLVIEVTSASTRREDLRRKPDLYRRLGVRELWLVDPLCEYLETPLLGRALIDGEWAALPGSATSAHSPLLGLEFRVERDGVRLADSATGRVLPSPQEASDELEALRAELERLRGEQP